MDLPEPTFDDVTHLRQAIHQASLARARGDHPFGACLVDDEGRLLMEGGNTVVTSGDGTAHAELALLSRAMRELGRDRVRGATLYASTEPCSMCAGAARWAGIGRVVFGTPQEEMAGFGSAGAQSARDIRCRAVLAAAGGEVQVVGPMLQTEARKVHEGFWPD
ncbi:nucleoside deaminase [Frigidibacter oleivorans]|uniref:nucleoside deaminase n=1 Tax=Frigidibacter oleivorans TaxID=2487129 RepID=UPI000F8F42FD|nr:nucleoside deaminase [Frigidibacter oleivorans]